MDALEQTNSVLIYQGAHVILCTTEYCGTLTKYLDYADVLKCPH